MEEESSNWRGHGLDVFKGTFSFNIFPQTWSAGEALLAILVLRQSFFLRCMIRVWGSVKNIFKAWVSYTPHLKLHPRSHSRSFKKFFLMYIYFWERGRQSMSRGGEGQRERETQNPKQAPGFELSAQSPTGGSNPRAMRSWPELKSDAQRTEPPRCPQDPFKCLDVMLKYVRGFLSSQSSFRDDMRKKSSRLPLSNSVRRQCAHVGGFQKPISSGLLAKEFLRQKVQAIGMYSLNHIVKSCVIGSLFAPGSPDLIYVFLFNGPNNEVKLC